MSNDKPIYILPENVQRTLGKDAQRNNILAARVVSEVVRTTLGPKGMDKMLVDSVGNIVVTNDGVTILEEMEIDHPAAKMVVEIAKTQEEEVGDGTTTVAMLAGKLLENAENLLDKKIHPTVIAKGYRLAAEKAKEILNGMGIDVDSRDVLRKIAVTAMTGKGAEGNREKLADLIVSSVDQVSSGREVEVDDIKIEKIKGDEIGNSELIQGIVLDKEVANDSMPKRVEDARIALIDFPLELKSPEAEAKISVSSPEQLQSFIESEERYLKEITDRIIMSGTNVIFCQKGIDDVAQYYLAKAGIMACRRTAKSDMEKLSRATGGKIVSNIEGVNDNNFGKSKMVEEIKKNDDGMIYVRGCENPRAVTILVKASTGHVVDEIERAVKDGLGDVIAAVKSGKVVTGGGAIEIELAKRLRQYSRTLGGREQLAVEEFANALEFIPETLAENAGLDPIDILTELKKRHEDGMERDGLNLFNNKIENCFEAGIVEPLKVKTLAINSASEVAVMILRIDDVLISSGSKQMPASPYAGMD
ncbi:thermosome subunit [Candidatus Pacearchaeota archaeon CG10_big_fil_rev_8_21_14_0_10_35_219]|nr:thermosome subunit [Candidatus Pacearchaeota archaeon]OIO43013.1 MAG: thermosome subunit [Candidatus Pacearchaeota archaeon CG1_02_35_32]PIO08139.1 MAG: thermosome subunit [Candidatus Pacearchaeota archaeon CG10_big_fil_rev_8_21_14_0_10_35_219]PIY81073.1 MAG: thermosome subunit [Candidatus Pacearchaeota archaeon CG_4_10_14_0_8_um_filter_35_169]PIZ79945.1 MAG: thermosome subunit [Candidatus Pacearchaeota archaeon CG_4_10_14_0_2_um_filter_35_33]PJA70217.1 MAG: thermosome subunit [Candidatus P